MIHELVQLWFDKWRSAVEILLLSVVIYYGYLYFRGTRGAKVLTGLAIVFLTLTLISQLLNLVVISFTTTGGNALKFYSSVRMDIRRIGAIKNGEEVVGSMTRVKVVKNKVAPPFREAEFEIMYGTGISKEGELIELGVLHNLVEKSGSWYSYKGERIGQGKDNARTFLQQHPEIAKDIEAQVRAKLIPEKATMNRGGDVKEA